MTAFLFFLALQRISPEIFSRKENLFARKKGLTTFGGKGTRPPSHNIEAFRSILQSSKNIVAIAGAGLSAASGLAFNCISLRIF